MLDLKDNENFRRLLLSYPAKAIQFLHEEYYHSLLTISERLTQDKDASKDILQDAFIHIWANHEWLSQHHEKPLIVYLAKIVKYKSITHFKKSNRIVNGNTEALSDEPLVDGPIETKLIDMETQRKIRAVIETFPKREKECLLLSVDENLKTIEIASKLNVSQKAVQRSLTSAYKRLRLVWASLTR